MLKALIAAMLMTTPLALPLAAAQEDVTCPPDDILPWVDCMTKSIWWQLWYVYGALWAIVYDDIDKLCHLITGGPCWITPDDAAAPAPLP